MAICESDPQTQHTVGGDFEPPIPPELHHIVSTGQNHPSEQSSIAEPLPVSTLCPSPTSTLPTATPAQGTDGSKPSTPKRASIRVKIREKSASAKPRPAKSAWSKGPPQTSAPSPCSQSLAPSTQSQSHLTHSRRPSALGQEVPIKNGVSIPRNNIGAAAAKQGLPVAFGSIDDASAPISSSPAAPNPIKESVVKSFGTVPAAPLSTASHMNGKASISAARGAGVSVNSPSTSSSGPSASASSSSAKPATISSGPKLEKPDIKKLFQSPSAPAATAAETQSPSLRSANLPSQQQSQNHPPSQSQFSHQYTTRQAGPSSGGNDPRSQPPNGGAPGLSSPRLGHTPQQPQGQPPVPAPGMPQYGWPGYYGYSPPEYMGYQQWGYVQGVPPQSAHPHGRHLGQPQHGPPHPMPLSPRNATPSSSARLNASSSAFVPSRPTSKIVLNNQEGNEVPFESLKQNVASPAATAPPSGQGSPFRGGSSSTPKRVSIRMETEEQRKKRLAEEEKKKQRRQAEAEEKERARREEEERKVKEEEECKRKEEAENPDAASDSLCSVAAKVPPGKRIKAKKGVAEKGERKAEDEGEEEQQRQRKESEVKVEAERKAAQDKQEVMTFGPSSVLSKNNNAKRKQRMYASSSNMFSMLSKQADAAPNAKNEPLQRKKLVLAPRSVPKDSEGARCSVSIE